MGSVATTLWEFESQIPTRQVGVIDHFTIGPRWEKRELHPQRFLCNAFTERRHTYLIVAFLPEVWSLFLGGNK